MAEFVGLCRELYQDYDVIYPLVKESVLKKYHRFFPRPFFRMIPDTILPADYIKPEDFREDGRVGFRITSMNCEFVRSSVIDRRSYNLRKFYRKSLTRKAEGNIRQKLDPAISTGPKHVGYRNDVHELRQALKMVALSGAGNSWIVTARGMISVAMTCPWDQNLIY